MDIVGTIISVLVSVVVGVCLWLFLPRGVVLTRRENTNEHSFEAWTIRNESALPVKILSAAALSVTTYNERRDRFDHIELDPDAESTHGISLSHDDEVDYVRMQDWSRSWKGEILRAGDTLSASVSLNCSLIIEYRRAGWSGVFERRKLVIHGGV